MIDSKDVEVVDMDGNPIIAGSVVRYIKTGTVGKVTDIMQDSEGIWVTVDTTGLLYKPETLVITDASELKEERVANISASDARSYVRSSGAGADLDVDVGQITGGG